MDSSLPKEATAILRFVLKVTKTEMLQISFEF